MKFILSIGAVASMALGACTNDLDLLPTDPSKITAGTFDEDPVGYMDRVMATATCSSPPPEPTVTPQ